MSLIIDGNTVKAIEIVEKTWKASPSLGIEKDVIEYDLNAVMTNSLGIDVGIKLWLATVTLKSLARTMQGVLEAYINQPFQTKLWNNNTVTYLRGRKKHGSNT